MFNGSSLINPLCLFQADELPFGAQGQSPEQPSQQRPTAGTPAAALGRGEKMDKREWTKVWTMMPKECGVQTLNRASRRHWQYTRPVVGGRLSSRMKAKCMVSEIWFYYLRNKSCISDKTQGQQLDRFYLPPSFKKFKEVSCSTRSFYTHNHHS